MGYSYCGDSVVLDEASESGFRSVRKHVTRESSNPDSVLKQGHMSSLLRPEQPYVRGAYGLQLFGGHGEVDKLCQLKTTDYYSATNPLNLHWWIRVS